MKPFHDHYAAFSIYDEPLNKRYFLKFFTKKRKKARGQSMSPAELKKLVISIGRGKKVDITRLAYDGTPEDPPVAVKIIDIGSDHFTGKFINVERSISESQSEKMIFVKGGGGTIDFRYEDGDILKIEEDIDEEIAEQRNVEEIKEILDALDLNEEINISYYDKNEGGFINGLGILQDKNMETFDFTVVLKLINEIALEQPREVSLNLDRDQILDLEVVI
jgi:hypothetical protein